MPSGRPRSVSTAAFLALPRVGPALPGLRDPRRARGAAHRPRRGLPLRLGNPYVEDSLPRGLLRRRLKAQGEAAAGGPRGPGGAWGQRGRGQVRAWDRDRGEGVGQRGLRPAQGGIGEKHLELWGTGVSAEACSES